MIQSCAPWGLQSPHPPSTDWICQEFSRLPHHHFTGLACLVFIWTTIYQCMYVFFILCDWTEYWRWIWRNASTILWIFNVVRSSLQFGGCWQFSNDLLVLNPNCAVDRPPTGLILWIFFKDTSEEMYRFHRRRGQDGRYNAKKDTW
jgi:hypothetical protein